jgi:hypothetical protein
MKLAHISEFRKDMMRQFEMTDLGHVSYFLGIEFHRSRRYATEILKKFDIEYRNHAVTTAETRFQLSKNNNEGDVDLIQPNTEDLLDQ